MATDTFIKISDRLWTSEGTLALAGVVMKHEKGLRREFAVGYVGMRLSQLFEYVRDYQFQVPNPNPKKPGKTHMAGWESQPEETWGVLPMSTTIAMKIAEVMSWSYDPDELVQTMLDSGVLEARENGLYVKGFRDMYGEMFRTRLRKHENYESAKAEKPQDPPAGELTSLPAEISRRKPEISRRVAGETDQFADQSPGNSQEVRGQRLEPIRDDQPTNLPAREDDQFEHRFRDVLERFRIRDAGGKHGRLVREAMDRLPRKDAPRAAWEYVNKWPGYGPGFYASGFAKYLENVDEYPVEGTIWEKARAVLQQSAPPDLWERYFAGLQEGPIKSIGDDLELTLIGSEETVTLLERGGTERKFIYDALKAVQGCGPFVYINPTALQPA